MLHRNRMFLIGIIYEAEHWICLSEMRNYAAFSGEYQE